ncbi:hypothetical protein AX14_001555 [Amanita brunnescens Koide BX004]|nr:hypothetical protein AX14_001555 [Amanita brunnescens Koide BX004]
MHHARHQEGNPNFHQPGDYKDHRVSILKRHFWIQHDTLVFEICHNPPLPGFTHPPFYICVDRSADRYNKSLAFDGVACSPMIPDPPHTTTLWSLQVTVNNNLNNNPLLNLAALLLATFRVAPEHTLFHYDCFWHASAIERAIQEKVLTNQQGPAIVENLQVQWRFFQLHRCLGRVIWTPTEDEINDIGAQYVQLLEDHGIQVPNHAPNQPAGVEM